MKTKREIRAKDVVSDIRTGMSNADIMEKYHISPKGLRSIFAKLLDAKVMGVEELQGRVPTTEEADTVTGRRGTPRCYPVTVFPI